jgi:hypothetical protein
MGYKFTEQNYIFAAILRYNDEKRIHIAWTSWIVTF